ncbi:MAG: transporter substrate-binding domain-containing protein [Alphaproteobacteria bacterium]|nr:transporter substrate-binding domain-containing protein [Alphaproteobacteria bacterium]
MKQFLTLSITCVLSAVVAWGVVGTRIDKSGAVTVKEDKKESVYDRVVRTDKIRCGYALEYPALDITPNSGQLSGIFYDLTQRIGDLLDFEIVWAEEAGWSDLSTGLENNRYDLACIGKWIYAPQTKGAIFTMPTYFSAVHAYTRVEEGGVKPDLSNLDSSDFTIATIDGELNYYLAQDHFPHAKTIELPALTDPGLLIQNILTNKADVVFLAAGIAERFMKENPGKIKQLSEKPVAVFDTAYMVKSGEEEFVNVLNAALRQLHSDGYIRSLIKKHEGEAAYKPLRQQYSEWE